MKYRFLELENNDLSHGWVCSACGYNPGKDLELKLDHFLGLVERGIIENTIREELAPYRSKASDKPWTVE